MRRTYLAVAALALVGLLVIAGCGGGGSSSSSGGESSGGGAAETTSETKEEAGAETKEAGAAGAKPAKSKAAVVKVMKTPDLGTVIVDSKGMTLYDFHKDKGTTSACYGACAGAWPPLLTEGKPTAAGGAESSLLGVTKRKDGTEQVTYDGHPLYGFVEDKKPGDTTGNDVDQFGAEWYALEPNGEEPDDD